MQTVCNKVQLMYLTGCFLTVMVIPYWSSGMEMCSLYEIQSTSAVFQNAMLADQMHDLLTK